MRLFLPREAARFLRIPLSELLALVAEGQLSSVEFNGKLRFSCEHLIKFLREHTRPRPPQSLSEDS